MNPSSSSFNSLLTSHREQGTILIFTALLAGVICAFLALAVDVSRIADAKSEKVVGAEESAIAALEKYLSYNPGDVTCPPIGIVPDYGCRHKTKFNRSKDSAASIGSWNLQTFLGTPHITNVADFDAAAGADRKGEILSGRWWNKVPAGCAPSSPSCPCTDPLPCFQACADDITACAPVSALAPDNGYASAMRVTYYTPTNNKLNLIFGGFIDMPDISIGYSANAATSPSVATILPKFTTILIDLGRNMTIDSHLPWEKEVVSFGTASTPDRREFAYRLPGGCPALPAGNGVVDTTVPNPNNVSGNIADVNFGNNWDQVPVGIKANYTCVTTPEGTSYLVDSFNPDPTYPGSPINPALYSGPEPLRSSLLAVHAFLQEFAKDASGQDLICPIFYDHGQRDVGLGSGPGLDCFDKFSASFDRLLKMTSMDPVDLADVADNCAGVAPAGSCPNAYRAGLFPRMGSFSDLPGAMDRAYNLMLTYSNFWYNENNVIIFSNGLSNCITNAGVVECRGYLQKPLMTNTALQDDYYAHHKISLNSVLYDKSGNLFKTRRVKVSTFIVGKSVLAHNDLLKSTSGTECKSDTEMRSRHFLPVLRFPAANDDAVAGGTIDDRRTDNYDKYLLFPYFSLGITKVPYIFDKNLLDPTKVLTGAVASQPLQTYYYPPPNLYFASSAINTQGLYQPVRTLCPAVWPVGAPQTPNQICLKPPWSAPPLLLAAPLNTEAYTPKMANLPGPAGVPNAWASLLITAGITDKYGRLLCDPTLAAAVPVGENQATWSTKLTAMNFLSRRPITLVKVP